MVYFVCDVGGGRLHLFYRPNSINTITLDLENIKEFNCNVINNLFFHEEKLMMASATGPNSLEWADIINLITSI